MAEMDHVVLHMSLHLEHANAVVELLCDCNFEMIHAGSSVSLPGLEGGEAKKRGW